MCIPTKPVDRFHLTSDHTIWHGPGHPNVSPFAKVSIITRDGMGMETAKAFDVNWDDVGYFRVIDNSDVLSQLAAGLSHPVKMLWPGEAAPPACDFQEMLQSAVGANMQVRVVPKPEVADQQVALINQNGDAMVLFGGSDQGHSYDAAAFIRDLIRRYATLRGRLATLVDHVNSDKFDENSEDDVRRLEKRLRHLRKFADAR